jgi:type VI secretion system protein VasJ
MAPQEVPSTPATDDTPVAAAEPGETAPTAAAPASPTEGTSVAPTVTSQEATPGEAPRTAPPTQDATPAPPEAPRQTRPAPSAAAGVSSMGPTTFDTESDVHKALRGCQTTLRNAAAFWLRKNLANPLAYRLTRIATWMLVSELPQHQDQVTQLSRPQPEVVQGYEDALQAGHYAGLIPEVEAHFARAPFWLDAHRFTAMALDVLGPTYAAAKHTVVVELASFVRRLPEVLDLKFADGTPFANELTHAWIEGEVLERSPGAEVVTNLPLPRREVETATPQEDGTQPTPWVQVREAANHLAAAGSVIAAAALFQDGLRQAASQRERFMWRLQQAGFCYEVGLLDVAIPQLEFLQEQGERFVLDEWEPALSLEVIQLLLRCYYALVQKTKKPAAELVDKAERLHAQLCRLDVTAALAMDEPG